MKDISRRNFVKGAAAATVLIGTSKTSWAGANDRIRVAVLGINGRGKTHLNEFATVDGTEVTTICDPDASLFEPRTKEFFTSKGKKAPKTEQDIRRVLDDKDIDVISIATPITGTLWRPSGRVRQARMCTSKSR